MNKRKLYDSLCRAFWPELLVVYSTTKGIKMCEDEPNMVDYDILSALEPKPEMSKTWVQISNLSGVPHIIIKINDFFVDYDLGEKIVDIENRKPSYRNLPPADQTWVGKKYTEITQAFVDAGYVF